MSIAEAVVDLCTDSSTDELDRLRAKTLRVVADFGSELLHTPIDELRRMTDMPAEGDLDQNLFARIWDRYRFVPTASLLRRFGDDVLNPGMANLIDRLEMVWNRSEDEP